MIQGYRSIPDLDALHQDQHRLLFANCLGVIEKVATVAPTADTLPVGYMQFANISGSQFLYINLNGTVYYISVDSGAAPTVSLTTDVTGALPIANGGTGQITAQLALNALAGAVTANRVLRGNGTNIVLAQIVLTTDVTGVLPAANGGTGSSAAANAASGVVVLDASSKLPAVDGSQLTGITAIPVYAVGDYKIGEAVTERTTTNDAYTKLKEIKIGGSGALRIKFDLLGGGGAAAAYGKIYRNGGAVGTEYIEQSGGYGTKSEDISGWSAGDLLQIYIHANTAGQTVKVKNLYVYVDDPQDMGALSGYD